MLLNYILALLKYMLELLKNKLVLIKINLYFDNTSLYFNNSQLACREIQINFVEHHASLYTMFFISNDSFFLTCISTLRLTCCSASFHFCETTRYLTLRKGRYVIHVAGPNTCAGHIKLSC